MTGATHAGFRHGGPLAAVQPRLPPELVEQFSDIGTDVRNGSTNGFLERSPELIGEVVDDAIDLNVGHGF